MEDELVCNQFMTSFSRFLTMFGSVLLISRNNWFLSNVLSCGRSEQELAVVVYVVMKVSHLWSLTADRHLSVWCM